MHDLRDLRANRIQLFTRYLKRMHHRAHIEGHGCCFIIFSESPSGESDDPHFNEHTSKLLVFAIGESGALDQAEVANAVVNDAWRERRRSSRFIQFSFERHWFCIDLPQDTLFKIEAEKILRDRSGFFYLRDLPQFTLYEEDVEGHDPFRKIYLYGDEHAAAEDMAYIFYNVWRFPLDWTFFVKAASFGDGPDWEEYEPV